MATEIDKHYAKKLKKLREGRKIKQFAMLDYLHLDSQQQYSDLENGKKHFTDELIIKICKYFNISVIAFIGGFFQSNNMIHSSLIEDLDKLNSITDPEIRAIMLEKYMLETEIKAIDAKLKAMHNEYVPLTTASRKNSVYVII